MVKSSAAPPFLHFRVHDRHSTCAREGELGCRHIVENNHLGCSNWDRNFAMATAQQEDAEVQACHTANSTYRTFPSVLNVSHFCAICLLVALGQLYHVIHGLSNPSVRTTMKLIASKFIWKECKSRLDSRPSSALLVSLPRFIRTQKPLSRCLRSPTTV